MRLDMDRWEALARRYCACSGRDPDKAIDGVPLWERAAEELCAAISALDTFDLDVRTRFERPVQAATRKHEDAAVIRFPGRAAS